MTPLRASVALRCFRISGAGLLLSLAGLLALRLCFDDPKGPWASICMSVVRYVALIAGMVFLYSAACCLYGRWAWLLGGFAVASAAVIYFAGDNLTLLWMGLCGMWCVVCLLFPALGHALRRKSQYTEEEDDSTAV